MAKEQDTISDIIEAENLVSQKFADDWKRGKDNTAFYAGEHWTKEQKAKFEKQGRIPFQFDKTSHSINTLLGTQRESRTQIQFIERTQEDAPRVDTMNAVYKYYEDANEFQYAETDVFADGIVSRYGVFGCEIVKREGIPFLKLSRVPYDTVLWDRNSREYDLSEAQFMSHWVFYRRNALIVEYPDQRKLIEAAGFDMDTMPQAKPFDYTSWVNEKKDLIGVRRFYERGHKTKYMVWQSGMEVPEETPFDTKKDAQRELKKRLALYDKVAGEARAMGMPVIQRPEFQIVPIEFPIVNRTVAILNGVLEETRELPLGDFPLTVYFAYHHDGQFWSAIDRLRDPQVFYNRMMAQADYSVGTMAKGVLRIDPNLPRNQKAAIKEGWGKTGGTFEAKAGQMEMYEGRGPAPQLFSMMDRAENILDETFGGANFLGLKQTASESGRAVLARQQQAGLDNFVVLDNMRRTKQLLAKKVAYYLTNDIPQAQKLRIMGSPLELQGMQSKGVAEMDPRNPSVAYAEVNTTDKNTITGLEVDVVVGEAAYSPTKLQAAMNAMVDTFKAIPGLPPPPTDVIIDLAPIPQELKERWKANAQPPPSKTKVSVNYKDLPLDAKAEVLKEMGLTSDMQQLAMKELSSNPLVQTHQKGINEQKAIEKRNEGRAALTPKEQAGQA